MLKGVAVRLKDIFGHYVSATDKNYTAIKSLILIQMSGIPVALVMGRIGQDLNKKI